MQDNVNQRAETAAQLKQILSEVKAESRPSHESEGQGFGFLGLSWMVLGVLSAVISGIPFQIDWLTRIMFLVFALMSILVGASYIDSIRNPKRGSKGLQGGRQVETAAQEKELRRVK